MSCNVCKTQKNLLYITNQTDVKIFQESIELCLKNIDVHKITTIILCLQCYEACISFNKFRQLCLKNERNIVETISQAEQEENRQEPEVRNNYLHGQNIYQGTSVPQDGLKRKYENENKTICEQNPKRTKLNEGTPKTKQNILNKNKKNKKKKNTTNNPNINKNIPKKLFCKFCPRKDFALSHSLWNHVTDKHKGEKEYIKNILTYLVEEHKNKKSCKNYQIQLDRINKKIEEENAKKQNISESKDNTIKIENNMNEIKPFTQQVHQSTTNEIKGPTPQVYQPPAQSAFQNDINDLMQLANFTYYYNLL